MSKKKIYGILTLLKAELCPNAGCTPRQFFFHQSLLSFKIGKMHTSEFPFKDSKDIYISQTVADVQV